MPSFRRVLGVVVALLASVTLLSACQKPLPGVTVLAGHTTTVVRPQTYCFDLKHCHFPDSQVGRISAVRGSTLLVDVPRAVAGRSWSVTSAVEKSNGTFQAISGATYSSGIVHNTHSTTVQVPFGVGTYYLVVGGGSSNGSWVVEVAIHK